MPIKKYGETSYKETSFGIIPRSKLILLEIEGIKRAWDFILMEHKKGDIPITSKFFKEIHAIGFQWIFHEMGGKFRKIDVVVSAHNPPKFYLVPQLMEDFSRDIKMRIQYLPAMNDLKFLDRLIEFLAWMHHRFLWIHPFQDYNGRIGRLLTNVILLNLNLPPIELKIETKQGRRKYIKALQKADNGDLSCLEKLIKSSIIEATKKLI